MIFVTVGTHEDSFDRLVMELDRLCANGCLQEEVFIQIGYSKTLPAHAKWAKFLAYQEMDAMIKSARIVITHGGPGSIMHALRYNKVPIVVPRQKKFAEHVDDHQVYFSQRIEKEGKAITVLEISQMEQIILDYDRIAAKKSAELDQENNLDRFIAGLEEITRRLVKA